MRNIETINKYFAGLFDSDGCVSFGFTDKGSHSVMWISVTIAQSLPGGIKVLQELQEHFQVGHWSYGKNGGVYWNVRDLNEVERLLGPTMKHMVIKGRHAQRLLRLRRFCKGRKLSNTQVERLKKISKLSRLDAGPIKPKNHITWAWLAGYIDGDGSLYFKPPQCYLNITAHQNDRVGFDLIQKSLGGNIRPYKDRPHLLQYYLGLGKTVHPAKLQKLVRFLRIKKWRAERMLAYRSGND